MSDLAQCTVRYVATLDDAQDMMAWLGERRDWLGFDLETEGLHIFRDKIRLAQFGDHDKAWAIPYRDWRGLVADAVRSYDRPMVAHNLLFDDKFLAADGIDTPQHLVHDTMVMAHLVDPMRSIALKSCASRYVDRRAWSGSNVLSAAMAKQGWTWATVPTDFGPYWQYGGLDTILTARLAAKLWPKIQPYQQTYGLELGCIRVLRNAALRGMKIDLEYVRRKSHELEDQLEVLAQHVPCNPLSEQQLVTYLQSRGARLVKRTEKGNLSVDDDVLTALTPTHPECKSIQEYRGAYKLLTSYFRNFESMNVDGVLRPSIKPVGARTARMSITDPALQTLPRGRVVRDAFVTRDDHKMILADFKQMELRVLAHYAQEEGMIAAIRRGEDLHDFLASSVYGPDFTREQRQTAKNANFAKIYGAGDEKFAQTAGISLEEARSFLRRYDELFPGVGRFQQQVVSAVQGRARKAGDKMGWVYTCSGRRLPVEASKAYKGVNFITQSSATADVLKERMIELDAAGLGNMILLPVHDELLFEAPTDCVEDAREQIARVMPDRRTFDVPLDIDIKTVDRWGEAYA